MSDVTGRCKPHKSDECTPVDGAILLHPCAGAAVFSEPTSPTLGAPAALRSHIGSPPSCATLPDDISKIPSVSNRKNSVQNSIPSFQTGMRPW